MKVGNMSNLTKSGNSQTGGLTIILEEKKDFSNLYVRASVTNMNLFEREKIK